MEIIIGKNAGFCYGVKRAVEGSIKQIENNKSEKIYCLGELVHNKQVITELQDKGIKFIDNLEQVKDRNAKVIIRAHGITKEEYKVAKDNDINIEDYTCPNVIKIHEVVNEYAIKGYYIILCGKKSHPENIGTASYCGKFFSVIENEDEIDDTIENIKKVGLRKILILAQTTYSLNKFKEIQENIIKRLDKNVEIIVKDTICRATKIRQEETDELSKRVDCMIIIGGRNSSNTNKLFEIAKNNCKNTILIETEQEINKEELSQYNLVGIMAGASTPMNVINDVVKLLNI